MLVLSASERYAMHNVSDILFFTSGVFGGSYRVLIIPTIKNISKQHQHTSTPHVISHFSFTPHHTIMYGESDFLLQMDGSWPVTELWLKPCLLKT